ncbi:MULTISPECIES: type II secretion system F family protein [Nocardiopsis]|uniref:Flp pilus assembly protein TadB n=2 Tax=Nocardiopsis TaxID=2013 RepID=A0A840WBB6_9ACTN|nr:MULTISPECIES: type II secretion system F family protein [Nocardiopsis]MBB5493422.1 Flp pilus assembly protein TadB [Nocardiopsis metallicus]MCK9873038.1 type II secretion system F family protein [Nocardiopsis dassonvillei]MEE2051634.1 type II secretion system F family protein [Nocardiopsis umidischolae]
MNPLVWGAVGGLLLGAGAGLLVLEAARRLAERPRPGEVRVVVTREHALRLLGAMAGGLVVWGVTGWPVAIVLVAAAVWWLPAALGPDRAHTAQVERIDAVAGWVEQIRDLMAGASGLHQAIIHTVPTAPAPVRADVAHLAEQLQNGAPPEEALREFAHRVDVPTADLAVAALSSAATRQAADLGPLLASLATAARDQAGMLVRVAATRARTRTSARIITATTLALAAVLLLLNREFFAPYDTPTGQLVLAVIGGLWAAGLVWLVRMSRVDLGPRLLAPDVAADEEVVTR